MAGVKDVRGFFFHTTVSEVMENQKAERNAGIFGRKTSARFCAARRWMVRISSADWQQP